MRLPILLLARYGRKGENARRMLLDTKAEASDDRGHFQNTRDFDLKFSSSNNHLLAQGAVWVMLINLQGERFRAQRLVRRAHDLFKAFARS